ncbi:hypothetical protein [Amylibacter sp. SFDW26]|nr:hypothetical protein [Amylibacter sp. SFDW26]
MPQIKMTDVAIRNLPLPELGQITHWDIAQSGFGIRVSQGGIKLL